jgi:hypothetical protein
MSEEEWVVLRNRLWARSSMAYDVIVERVEHLRMEVTRWEHTLLHRLGEEEGEEA